VRDRRSETRVAKHRTEGAAANGAPGNRQDGLWPPTPLAVVVLALVYFAAGKFGLRLATVHESASVIWPPTGIALAAVLMWGRRVWPAILVASFLVNITTAGTTATSLGIAVGNTLEAYLGGWLVRRYAGGPAAFDRPRDVFTFVVAAIGCTALSATIGVTSLTLGGEARWGDYGPIWLTWWLGDAGGALLVAPLLVLWARPPRPRPNRERAPEALALALFVALCGLVAFGGNAGAVDVPGRGHPLAFLALPPLLWAAFRFGPRGTITAACGLSAIATWGTLRVTGPAPIGSLNESLLLLQALMAFKSVTAMSLAAVVAEHRRAHAALERRTAELARSNADLQQFAYAASHDLREPLRMVTGFLDLLKARYHGRLDRDADDFIRFAVDGAARMQALIDGLLACARAGQAASRTPTDSGRAVDEAVANLEATLRDSGASVVHDGLPIVYVDHARMVQVFQNLIANSVKFRGEAPPEIRISARREDGDWIFSIRDNGIGIEPGHEDRIFGMFQRFHDRDRYPGAGIGLAICKRVVEAGGGRIWVESAPGRGTTFRFALPAGPPGAD
jgi:signal transduction histidine kinase